MNTKSDFLILGAGIIGCAAAYYLSREGASVTVLERGDTAFGTAGASGGLVNWITCAESQMELFMRSQDMLEHLQEELDADFELNYNSYNMQIISNEIEWKASEQLVKDFKLPGFEARLIDSEESHRLEPSVTDDMLGSIYVPRVHYLNPIKLALAYRRAAERHGAVFINDAGVTGLIRDGAAVTGARTAKGEHYAAVTVNCTGVWSDKLSAMAGVEAPIHPIRGEFVITEPTEHFCNTTISSAQYQTIVQHPELFSPNAIKYNLGFSVEQTTTGACIIHGTREMDSGLDKSVIPEVIELLVQTAVKFIPRLGKLKLMRAYAGVRPGTPDGDPYLGFCEGVPGFCECCGHGGEGIALSPATGEAMAELLLKGRTEHCDISRFSPNRLLGV